MSNMFRRTGGEDFPDKLKVLVSGPPKSGKTTLLGTVPNIVIADTEPHANNLQSVAHLDLPYVTVNGTQDLMNLRMVLSQDSLRQQAASSLGMPKIEAVGIDTVDTLQKIMKRERMLDQKATKFLRDDWGWLKEELTKIVESFTALPLHVFFVVHTKTQNIGSEDHPETIILPGLEGALSESIAGMVGYSLLSFRKQEVRPDGSPYTKYWLRAEGDQTYNFLGNRAGGRLPDVIEPDFKAIFDAAMASRPKQAKAPVAMPVGDVQSQQQAPPPPQQPVQAAVQNPPPVASNTGYGPEGNQSADAQNAQPQPVAQDSGHQNPQASQQPADKPAGDLPVNADALSHLKKIYDACALGFPEDTLKKLTMDDARDLARMWSAVQQDHVNGKGEKDSPQEEMIAYLASMEWLTDFDQQRALADSGEASVYTPPEEGSEALSAAVAQQQQNRVAQDPGQQIEPKIDGNIPEVLAWVGDDLQRVQEAYNRESGTTRPRDTLLTKLVTKGAQVPTPVQNPEPEAPAEPVTQPAPTVDAQPSEEQAVGTAQQVLGASVLATEEDEQSKPCAVCGKAPVDDLDIARLGQGRFGKWLCVADYIAETQKPRTPANA